MAMKEKNREEEKEGGREREREIGGKVQDKI
jgi:hypothetical protein